jgi:hypothetical protein
MILRHLQSGHWLSPIEALRLWGCFRLAARINDLREMGYGITTEWERDQVTGKRHARYRMGRAA